MSLSIWPSCSCSLTILTYNGLNASYTASKLLLLTAISILFFCAANADMVVFRTFSGLVAPPPYIFIIDLNFILNDVVARKICLFTNMKSAPSSSYLWWSSIRLDSGTHGMFCTCCVIVRSIFLLTWKLLFNRCLQTC